MNSTQVGLIGLGATLLIVCAASGAVLIKWNNDLKSQKETIEKLEEDLSDKSKEVTELEKKVKEAGDEVASREQDVEDWKNKTQVMGVCLDGVLEMFTLETYDQMVYQLGTIEAECEQSDKIIKELKKEAAEADSAESTSLNR